MSMDFLSVKYIRDLESQIIEFEVQKHQSDSDKLIIQDLKNYISAKDADGKDSDYKLSNKDKLSLIKIILKHNGSKHRPRRSIINTLIPQADFWLPLIGVLKKAKLLNEKSLCLPINDFSQAIYSLNKTDSLNEDTLKVLTDLYDKGKLDCYVKEKATLIAVMYKLDLLETSLQEPIFKLLDKYGFINRIIPTCDALMNNKTLTKSNFITLISPHLAEKDRLEAREFVKPKKTKIVSDFSSSNSSSLSSNSIFAKSASNSSDIEKPAPIKTPWWRRRSAK